MVPNLVQKCWSTPKLWPKNEIQNGGGRPPPSWIYFRLKFLTYSRLSTVDLNHHPKFHANISIGGWLTVIFLNLRWRPSAILDFRKPDFCPMVGLGLLIFHHDAKFGAKMLIGDQIRAQKRNSKWRPPPSWICFRLQFLTYSRLSAVDLNHHTKFRANISIGGWLMVIFQIQDGGRPPSWNCYMFI